MKSLKVLYAPIHYFYGRNFSSELICAYEIFTRVSRSLPGSVAISLTKLDEEPDSTRLVYKYSVSKPFFPNIWNNLQLIYFYSRQASRLLKSGRFSVIHHLFPFRIGRTFNPLFIGLGHRTRKVLGPVMLSVDFDNQDLQRNGFFDTHIRLFDRLVLLLDPVYSLLCRATLNRADAVVALNRRAKQELIAYGVPARKITIIPIGIDSGRFPFIPFSAKSRTSFRLLTVGYLTKRKGTELVIRALAVVAASHPRVHLTIIGDGPQRSELEKLVRDLHLAGHVTFAGFVDYRHLSQAYQKSHLLVSMSRAESWGQVYIDSLACGLPVISSRNDGANEIIASGRFGYLVTQEDYRDCARRINFLISHSRILAEFGLRARHEVEIKYDWDKVVIPRYLKLYRDKNG